MSDVREIESVKEGTHILGRSICTAVKGSLFCSASPLFVGMWLVFMVGSIACAKAPFVPASISNWFGSTDWQAPKSKRHLSASQKPISFRRVFPTV